jgi:cation transport regulator ChaC
VKHGRQYVFGYGSLLERRQPRDHADSEPTPAELRGYRRTWNVAMDNLRTIPGYKYYVDRATGERGGWFVTFLNVVADSHASVNGVLFVVTGDQLAELDERERNYNRIEISAQLSPPVDGETWVYAGADAAVCRFAVGRRTGRAVVSLDYYERVIGDFAALGPGAADRFKQLTDPPPCPVIDLRRVDVPPPIAPLTAPESDRALRIGPGSHSGGRETKTTRSCKG